MREDSSNISIINVDDADVVNPECIEMEKSPENEANADYPNGCKQSHRRTFDSKLKPPVLQIKNIEEHETQNKEINTVQQNTTDIAATISSESETNKQNENVEDDEVTSTTRIESDVSVLLTRVDDSKFSAELKNVHSTRPKSHIEVGTHTNQRKPQKINASDAIIRNKADEECSATGFAYNSDVLTSELTSLQTEIAKSIKENKRLERKLEGSNFKIQALYEYIRMSESRDLFEMFGLKNTCSFAEYNQKLLEFQAKFTLDKMEKLFEDNPTQNLNYIINNIKSKISCETEFDQYKMLREKN